MKMKRALALILSSVMICSAVPGEVLAAENTVEEITMDTDEMSETASETEEELDYQGNVTNTSDDSGLPLADGTKHSSKGRTTGSVIEHGNVNNQISWVLYNDGNLVISGKGNTINYGRNVMPPWYKYSQKIKRVTLERGITSIGDSTFADCSNLTSISIPEGVTSIGAWAFESCSSLLNITIPSTTIFVDNSAFWGCTGLKSVIYLGTEENWEQFNVTLNENTKVYYSSDHTHSWETKLIKSSTCTESGSKEIICNICGDFYIEKIPATGHKYSSWKTIKEATVLSAKKQRRICSVCKYHEDRNVGNKLKATIKLTATSLPLKIKQQVTTFKVYGLARGDSVISWKSSNSNIVKVTGKSNGSCVITAGSKTGKAVITILLKSKLKKNVTITVTKGNIATTKITGVPSSLKLLKGQKTTLKPSRFPISSKEKITYTSSNSKVVTVDANGRVTAKNKGTAIITVKSGKKYVKCKVVVSVVDKIVSNYNKLKTYITKYGYTNKNNDKVIKETYNVSGTNVNSECYIIYEKNKDTFEFLYFQDDTDMVSIRIIPSKSPVFDAECNYVVDGTEIYTTKIYQWDAKNYDGNSLYFERVSYNEQLYTRNKATERSQKMVHIALQMINTLILKEYVGIDLKGLGFVKFK